MAVAAPTVCRQCSAPTGFTDGLCAHCRTGRGVVAQYVHPTQLALPGLGPSAGDRWRNRNTGTIVAILGVEQRRKAWVTIRSGGNEQVIAVASLLRTFEQL